MWGKLDEAQRSPGQPDVGPQEEGLWPRKARLGKQWASVSGDGEFMPMEPAGGGSPGARGY